MVSPLLRRQRVSLTSSSVSNNNIATVVVQARQRQQLVNVVMLLCAAIFLGYYLPAVLFGMDHNVRHHESSSSSLYTYIPPPAGTPTSFDGVQARVFERKAIKCQKPTTTTHRQGTHKYHNSAATVGFFYQRMLKAASTTASSVNLRVARNAAQRKGLEDGLLCEHRVGFGLDRDMPMATRFSNRNTQKSFLWTTLRHPNARYTSHFFHQQVSRASLSPNDANFQAFLEAEPEEYSLAALSLLGYKTLPEHWVSVDKLVGSGGPEKVEDAVAAVKTSILRPRRRRRRGRDEEEAALDPNVMARLLSGRERATFREHSRVVEAANDPEVTSRLSYIIKRAEADATVLSIPKDDSEVATPRELSPAWIIDNPNKGRKDMPRLLQKAGAIAYVFKEGSREYGADHRRRRLSSSTSTTDKEVLLLNQILQEYDFIAIAERFEESMVVLMMLLKLKMADILHVPSKQSVNFDEGMHGQCFFMWKPFVTSGMKAYFASSKWQKRIAHDLALYNAANRSLDLTIQALGVSKFEKNMARYVQAQQLVQERCSGRVSFPCDAGGAFKGDQTDCLYHDAGCGNDCLDRVATELGLW